MLVDDSYFLLVFDALSLYNTDGRLKVKIAFRSIIEISQNDIKLQQQVVDCELTQGYSLTLTYLTPKSDVCRLRLIFLNAEITTNLSKQISLKIAEAVKNWIEAF